MEKGARRFMSSDPYGPSGGGDIGIPCSSDLHTCALIILAHRPFFFFSI